MRVIRVFLTVIMIIGLVGCTNQRTSTPNSEEVKFKLIKLKDLTNKQCILPDLDTVIGLLQKERGVFSFSHNGDLIVFIGLGQKNTAGYDLKVLSINTWDKSAIYDVKVKDTGPQPGSMVAQVITYPYVLINLGKAGGSKEIRVTDEQGNQYPSLSYYLNPPRVEKH